MQTIDELMEYVSHQIGKSDRKANDPVLMTSGGPTQDVWCQTPEKAIELWCYEFSKYTKDHPGTLFWGQQPELRQKKFFAKKFAESNYLDTFNYYTVHSTLEIHADAGQASHA